MKNLIEPNPELCVYHMYWKHAILTGQFYLRKVATLNFAKFPFSFTLHEKLGSLIGFYEIGMQK